MNPDVDKAVLDAVDQERARLRATLHNTLSQSLNAFRIFAALHARRLASGDHAEPRNAHLLLAELQPVMNDLEQVMAALAPVAFESFELTDYLDTLCQRMPRRVPCELRTSPHLALSRATAHDVYEIARDGVSLLSGDPKIESLEVAVTMDGETVLLALCGQSTTSSPELPPADSWALRILSARVECAGAQLQWDRPKEYALRLTCSLPLPPASA